MEQQLIEQDRHRIEQAAKSRFPSPIIHSYKQVDAFIAGAEYATLYEREQQAKEQFQKVMDGPYIDFDKDKIFMDGDNNSYSLMTSSDPDKREKGKQIRIHELTSRIKQLEAERSELRKENEELKFLLEFGKSYLPQGYVNDSKGNGFIFKDRLEAALNSLKTK